MDSEEKVAAVLAGEPLKVRDVSDGVSMDLGIAHSGAAPDSEGVVLDMANGNGKEGAVVSHNRNGSMSASFLAAPGYSPSFASLGDTNAFESHHTPRHSDTFEGFEPPRLSASQEVQETPKVTRPEGLSFTTPAVRSKITGDFETPEGSHAVRAGDGGFGTPSVLEDQEGEKQGAEDYTSPVANLVEKPLADAAVPSGSISREQVPAPGNVDSFSFGGVAETPQTPQTPDMFHANPKSVSGEAAMPSPTTPAELVPALGNVGSFSFGVVPETPNESHVDSKSIAGDVVAPSPSTPAELVPALGNVNSFPFGGMNDNIWPATTDRHYISSKKMPGHELLGSGVTTDRSSTPHEVNAVDSPLVAPASSSSDVPLAVETLSEPELVAEQPKADAVETVQPRVHEAPLPEEPAVAVPPSEKLDSNATDSPIVHAAGMVFLFRRISSFRSGVGSSLCRHT